MRYIAAAGRNGILSCVRRFGNADSFDRFYSEAEAALQSEGDMKAWGAIIGWAPMIMEASYLEEHDQEIEDILEIAKRIEVEITWDGGGETHSCEMKMENCLGK